MAFFKGTLPSLDADIVTVGPRGVIDGSAGDFLMSIENPDGGAQSIKGMG